MFRQAQHDKVFKDALNTEFVHNLLNFDLDFRSIFLSGAFQIPRVGPRPATKFV